MDGKSSGDEEKQVLLHTVEPEKVAVGIPFQVEQQQHIPNVQPHAGFFVSARVLRWACFAATVCAIFGGLLVYAFVHGGRRSDG